MRPLFTLPLSSCLLSDLSKAGFNYCEDLFDLNKDVHFKVEECLLNHGLTKDILHSFLNSPKMSKASHILKMELKRESIPTFSERMDELLGGGIHLGSIVHVCGPPGSGKTQLLLQLCVTVQIPVTLDGLNSSAVFIDSESGFSLSRLKDMAKGASDHCSKVAELNRIDKGEVSYFTVDSILNNVYYISIENVAQLMAALQQLSEMLSVNKKIKLLVIDSLTFPFLKIKNTLDRTRYVNNALSDFEMIASRNKVAVVFSNHLSTRMSGSRMHLSPSLGETLSHRARTTLLLGKSDSGARTCSLYKSCELIENTTYFMISEEGIRG